jgi:hypothetical protein
MQLFYGFGFGCGLELALTLALTHPLASDSVRVCERERAVMVAD